MDEGHDLEEDIDSVLFTTTTKRFKSGPAYGGAFLKTNLPEDYIRGREQKIWEERMSEIVMDTAESNY